MRGISGLAAIALALAILPVRAEERAREAVAEVDAYYKFSDAVRLYLYGKLGANTTANTTDGEIGAHVDFAHLPILHLSLRRDVDWERARSLLIRLGYEQSDGVDGRDDATHERRLVAELTGRFVLPQDFWLVNRLRLELRDLDGTSAQRYRYRLALERKTTVAGVHVAPYARAETAYDTRYDSWNRQTYQVGAEVELSKQWRIEPYVARQNDKVSASANVDRFGVTLKYYR